MINDDSLWFFMILLGYLISWDMAHKSILIPCSQAPISRAPYDLWRIPAAMGSSNKACSCGYTLHAPNSGCSSQVPGRCEVAQQQLDIGSSQRLRGQLSNAKNLEKPEGRNWLIMIDLFFGWFPNPPGKD